MFASLALITIYHQITSGAPAYCELLGQDVSFVNGTGAPITNSTVHDLAYFAAVVKDTDVIYAVTCAAPDGAKSAFVIDALGPRVSVVNFDGATSNGVYIWPMVYLNVHT